MPIIEPWGMNFMLWFLCGYVMAAAAFYAYITATAMEEPEALAAGGARPKTGYGETGDVITRRAA